MQKHFDLYKLVKPLLVNKHMLDCLRLCFWITSIDDNGRSNIYSVKVEERGIVLFPEPEQLISLLLVSIIGLRQRTKESCTSNASLYWWTLWVDKAVWSLPHTCTSLTRVIFLGISFYRRCGVFMSGIGFGCSTQIGSSFTSTTLPCWINVSCASGKLLFFRS